MESRISDVPTGDFLTDAPADLEALFATLQMLGNGGVSLKEMATEYDKQVEALRSFEAVQTATTFGGLLTVPELQSSCGRLEALIHLAVAYCRGVRKPRSTNIAHLFSKLGEGSLGRMEDPAEDIFVSNITTQRGNFRVLEGVWESAGFYTQRMINVAEGMPATGGYETLRESIYALLALSDFLCERAGLTRNMLGSEIPEETLASKLKNSLNALRQRVTFTKADLETRGIPLEALDVFIFDPNDRMKMREEAVGNSILERYPLIVKGEVIHFVLPTATSVAIRRHLTERMVAAGMRDALANGIAREYGTLFAGVPLLGGNTRAPIEFHRTKDGLIAGVMSAIDAGRYLSIVFFAETLREIEKTGIAGFQPGLELLANDVDKWIDHFYGEARKDPGFRDCITLIVGCGIGRGAVDFVNDKSRENWRMECLSAADFYTLSWLHGFKPLSLWRLLDAQVLVQAQGVDLHNVNGLLNLVAWSRKLDGHLIPHASIPDDFWSADTAHWMMIEQNSLRGLRHEVAALWDAHVEQDASGAWQKIRRDGDSVFKEDLQRPIYGCEERVGRWIPGAFLTASRAWWGTIEVPERTVGDRSFQRWKMLMVWLSRLAPIMEVEFPDLPSGPLTWTARFEGTIGEFDDDLATLDFEEARANICVEVDRDDRTVKLILTAGWEAANFHPGNIAERAFVSRAVEGFAELAGKPLTGAEREGVVSLIVPDSAAREMHAFRVRQFRDYVRGSVPKSPLIIDREDDATFRLGLGWKVREREAGNEISGKEACTRFINEVVRFVEDELCRELRQFNRHSTIIFALRNHESAAIERDWWNRTASAVLALRSDKEAVREAMAKHEFQLNGAFQASRLLVEFALCECPLDGGLKPGLLDFSRLMARVAFVQQVGGWSDAIRWDVMEPRVKISALGDIFVDYKFIDNIVAPYGRAGSDMRVDEAVKGYAKNLEVVEPSPESAKGALDKAFLSAWEEEFGASFDETRQFIDAIENLGYALGKAVFDVAQSELLAVKFDGETLPLRVTSALIAALTLNGRPTWRNAPEGYEERDIHPWRFRRRLSTLRKPLIQLAGGTDPKILVAPGMVRKSFVYMLGNYHRGDFPIRQLKPQMRAWVGRRADEQGRRFSIEVAARLDQLGWKTDTEVKITKLLRQGFERDYGDVDVLAWNPDTGRVLIIECKDLQYRKTFGEIAEQLSDFRGELRRNGKPDDLLKHLNRVELISTHLPKLAAYVKCGISKVESHLMFKNPVPMQFAWKRMEARVRLHVFSDLQEI